MEQFLIFYSAFCYLFLLGVRTVDIDFPGYQILFAPIFAPMVLGTFCVKLLRK